MKIVDYEALKKLKARLDATFASKAETDALAGDVAELKTNVSDIKSNLLWE